MGRLTQAASLLAIGAKQLQIWEKKKENDLGAEEDKKEDCRRFAKK